MESVKQASHHFAILLLRMIAGLSMAYHGYQKIFVFGAMDEFAQNVSTLNLPFPLILAWVAALSEFLGGLLVAIGLLTRIFSFLIFLTMLIAVFVAHRGDAFSVRELAVIYMALFGALTLTGGGQFSLDKK